MTKFLMAAILFPILTQAATTASIEVSYGGESATVPDRRVDAQINLIRMSFDSIESICYNGKAQNVVKMLDRVVKNAGNSVSNYESSTEKGLVKVNLSVMNKVKEIQTVSLEIASCK